MVVHTITRFVTFHLQCLDKCGSLGDLYIRCDVLNKLFSPDSCDAIATVEADSHVRTVSDCPSWGLVMISKTPSPNAPEKSTGKSTVRSSTETEKPKT